MQICSICSTVSHDNTPVCPRCGADLSAMSISATALRRLLQNPRVKAIRLAVQAEACPICTEMQGTYSKDTIPKLPVKGCSQPDVCNPFYEPILQEIYP